MPLYLWAYGWRFFHRKLFRSYLALFDLERVDIHLATFTWERKVGKTGQITIGGHHQRYSVGRAYARQQILVRFDSYSSMSISLNRKSDVVLPET